jgi:CubicO group peptidase (beta-lactamase class C family)
MSRGLSPKRLDRLESVLEQHVGDGAYLPGRTWLVSRRGQTHAGAFGTMELAGAGARVQRDTIFRLSSMSKPITAAAAMILVDEAVLRLDDPIDNLLPELADRRVLRSLASELDDTEPAVRPIGVRDLLTFMMGFGIVMEPRGTHPIQRAEEELQLGQGMPAPALPPPPDEWARRFGTLPLLSQPGATWMYHTGSDVLGVLIARATDRPLEAFFHERLFEPLGMKDTAFFVPPEKIGRLPVSYVTDYEQGGTIPYDAAAGGQWSSPPAFPGGGAGLVSTIDDYCAFGEMLLRKGMHGTTRILSRAAVELMMTDHITAQQKHGAALTPGYFDNHGWGLGGSVVTRRDHVYHSLGTYGWDGGMGTSFYVDPREEMVTLIMTQRAFESPDPPPVIKDFWTLAYAAIDDNS